MNPTVQSAQSLGIRTVEASGLNDSKSDLAISVENLGKCYHIYDKPQDRLKQSFLWGRKKLFRDFWALRDVSFEVKKGEKG